MFQYLERQVVVELQVFLSTDAPSPAAMRLQQEDIIAIEMRAYSASVRGDADHGVIQTGIGYEAKPLHQLGHAIVVQVYALCKHRPARPAHGRQACEGP